MKVAFLDRDGVINKDIGYLNKWDLFEYKPFVKSALRKLTRAGYQLIVVTNQSGIARGYYSEKDYNVLTLEMIKDLRMSGIHLLDHFYCPHYSQGIIKQYAVKCNCRKPRPGLFKKAFKKYNVDRYKSVMFGDRESDIQAAHDAGIEYRFLIKNDINLQTGLRIFDNLETAVDNFLITC